MELEIEHRRGESRWDRDGRGTCKGPPKQRGLHEPRLVEKIVDLMLRRIETLTSRLPRGAFPQVPCGVMAGAREASRDSAYEG